MPSVRKPLAITALASLAIAVGGALLPAYIEAGPPHRRPATGRHSAPRAKVVRPAPSPVTAMARTVNHLLAPPKGHVVLTVGGMEYYRNGHSYYRALWRDGRWVYVVVAPPVGVTVATLPPAPERVVVNGQVYYRDGATFYVQSVSPTVAAVPAVAQNNNVAVSPTATDAPAQVSPQYVVAKPPVGAIVEQLPPGAEPVASRGVTYFHADDVHYLPIQIGEQAKYVVVTKPN